MSRSTFGHCLAYLPMIAIGIGVGICTEFNLNCGWVPYACVAGFVTFFVGLIIRDKPKEVVEPTKTTPV